MNDQTERLPAFLRRRSRSCDQCSVDEASGERTPCDACHGTGRIADGRLELVLHCTWIQDRYVCPRKFWLRYGEMVEGTGPRVALNYGGAVHEALAARYKWSMTTIDRPLEQIEEEQVELLTAWFDTHPQPSDEWRNAGRAQDLIRAYNEEYATETWEVLAVEEEFEVEVGEVAVDEGAFGPGDMELPPSVPCYLAGRKDLVVAWHGGLWVVDHKTASDWGSGDSNSHLDEGRRSFQFRGYAWAEGARQTELQLTSTTGFTATECPRVFTPVLGTVGNYLISRKPYAKPPANGRPALPRNQFHRECYAFEPSVLDEWRSQFLETARDVLSMWQRGVWPHYDTGCGHWGRCEFFDYCEEAPERREAMLSSSMFQQKEFEREL